MSEAPVAAAATTDDSATIEDLRDAWHVLSRADRADALRTFPRDVAEEFFFELTSREQAQVLLNMPASDQRSWLRLLAPDDAADLIQEAPKSREPLLAMLD